MKVEWKLHLKSPVEKVYEMINTAKGRASFWAEKAIEKDGFIHFEFINGWTYQSRIIERVNNSLFTVDYFSARVTFALSKSDDNSTDLLLSSSNIPEDAYNTVHAGWVSVLLALKAACDHGVDLRNHNPDKCWDQRYADN